MPVGENEYRNPSNEPTDIQPGTSISSKITEELRNYTKRGRRKKKTEDFNKIILTNNKFWRTNQIVTAVSLAW
jgi:hypothetical protein